MRDFKPIPVLVSLLAPTVGFAEAPKWSAEFHTEFQKNSSENDTNLQDDKENASFQIKRARLGLKGSFGESYSYRLRLRFEQSKLDTATINGQSQGLDLAYIDHKFNSLYTLRVGRQLTGQNGVYQAGTRLEFWNPLARKLVRITGVSNQFNFGPMQTLKFNLFNSANDKATDPAAATRTTPSYGLTYDGSYMNGMLKANLSYYADPYKEIKTTAGVALYDSMTNTYASVGIRGTFAGVSVGLSHLASEESANSADTENTTFTQTTNEYKSNVIDVTYTMGKYRGFLAYDMSTQSTKTASRAAGGDVTESASSDTDYTTMLVSLEYLPHAKGDYFYFLTHKSEVTKPDGGDESTKTSLLLGLRTKIKSWTK